MATASTRGILPPCSKASASAWRARSASSTAAQSSRRPVPRWIYTNGLSPPDDNQETEIQTAERALAEASSSSVLLSAAAQFHAWLDAGGARAPIRVALIRYWCKHGLLRAPVPLTGPRALAAEAPNR